MQKQDYDMNLFDEHRTHCYSLSIYSMYMNSLSRKYRNMIASVILIYTY